MTDKRTGGAELAAQCLIAIVANTVATMLTQSHPSASALYCYCAAALMLIAYYASTGRNG